MGKALGRQLAAKGANILIVARTKSTLESAISEIKASAKNPSTQRFHYISADLTNPEESTRVLSETTQWNNGHPPDIVWANAGSSNPGLFLETSIATMRSQMDINYWANAYLAYETLKSWTKPSSPPDMTAHSSIKPTRHFIVTSSVAVFIGMAGYAPYSPAKSASRSLCDTLANEVNLYNGARYAPASKTKLNPEIRIHCVTPATIYTPGYEEEEKLKHAVTKMLEESDGGQTEDEVAAASIKGLEQGDYLIATTFLGKLMRAGMLGGAPRNGVGFTDTMLAWLSSIVWLFVGPDFDSKVWKFGKKNGA